VHKAPLLSQEGRLRHKEKAAKLPLKAQWGGSPTVSFKMVVKEPPRRASRVTPPDSGGEAFADPSSWEFILRNKLPKHNCCVTTFRIFLA
jgi:hypothetical protein